MKRLLLLLAGVGLLLAACGSSTGSESGETPVRPFSDIQANEFVFEAGTFDTSRTIFRVTTTEPAICAIVWGETEALGNFNNSLDMNGTGIVNHDVFLPGAEPGQTYYFQVQGSTADGGLFRSELGTFTVPEVEAGSGSNSDGKGEQRGANLAMSATIVDVSSEFSASWAAVNAIDGDLSTEWSTAGDGDDAYLVLDLGEAQEISGVEFITRSMADGTAITTTYWVTVDAGPRFGPFPAGSPANPSFQGLEATGQVIRFESEDTTGGNIGAVEVGVFAPAG